MMPICKLVEKDGIPNWCENNHQMYHRNHYALYAVDPGPKGQQFREYWRKVRDGEITVPVQRVSFLRKSINYLSSKVEHIAAGLPMVDDMERNHRRKRCNACEFRDRENDACRICGCHLEKTILGDKLGYATSKCFGWERIGLAIGCYNLPKLAELQIIVANDTCGEIPILLCDDSHPDSERGKAHAALAKKYPHVQHWPNPENYGHHRGDATAFWKAIQWGKIRDLTTVCKMSMRHLVTKKNWLRDAAKEFEASGEATGAANCIDNNTRLFIRSECVLLNVKQWFDSGAYKDLQGRNSYAPVVELHYNHIMCQRFGVMPHADEKGACELGKRWIWPLLQERRHNRTEGVIWHCANQEHEYRDLAKKYGIELEADFHCAGSEQRQGFAKDYRIG